MIVHDAFYAFTEGFSAKIHEQARTDFDLQLITTIDGQFCQCLNITPQNRRHFLPSFSFRLCVKQIALRFNAQIAPQKPVEKPRFRLGFDAGMPI